MQLRLFPLVIAAVAALALASPSFAQSAPDVELHATRVAVPLKVDGHLDEAVYASVPPVSDLWQQEPVEGEGATEKTEFWVFFDADRLYVSIRAWESNMNSILSIRPVSIAAMRTLRANGEAGEKLSFIVVIPWK